MYDIFALDFEGHCKASLSRQENDKEGQDDE